MRAAATSRAQRSEPVCSVPLVVPVGQRSTIESSEAHRNRKRTQRVGGPGIIPTDHSLPGLPHVQSRKLDMSTRGRWAGRHLPFARELDAPSSCPVASSRLPKTVAHGEFVIRTKLRMPRFARAPIRRERVLARLAETRSPFTLVSAPAGFGKTMSLATKGKPRSAAQRAATLASLKLARENNRVNKPGMNWRVLRQKENQGDLFQ